MKLIEVKQQHVFVCADAMELHESVPALPVTICNITADNANRVNDFRPKNYEKFFANFIKQKQLGVYAVSDGKVVGHAWAIVCCGKRKKANGYFHLSERESLIHFCNIEESRRGCGIYPSLIFALCGRLYDEADVSRIYIDTNMSNLASIRGIEKTGFKSIGKSVYVLILKKLVYRKRIV